MQTILRNLVYITLSIILSMVIFNYAQAGSRPLDDNTIIAYVKSSNDAITYGEYFDWQEENNPNLVEYCKGKAYVAMGIFNERETKSFEEIVEEMMPVKLKRGEVEYLEFVRMARDVTRKDNRNGKWMIEFTEKNVEDYANGELSACILQEY